MQKCDHFVWSVLQSLRAFFFFKKKKHRWLFKERFGDCCGKFHFHTPLRVSQESLFFSLPLISLIPTVPRPVLSPDPEVTQLASLRDGKGEPPVQATSPPSEVPGNRDPPHNLNLTPPGSVSPASSRCAEAAEDSWNPAELLSFLC